MEVAPARHNASRTRVLSHLIATACQIGAEPRRFKPALLFCRSAETHGARAPARGDPRQARLGSKPAGLAPISRPRGLSNASGRPFSAQPEDCGGAQPEAADQRSRRVQMIRGSASATGGGVLRLAPRESPTAPSALRLGVDSPKSLATWEEALGTAITGETIGPSPVQGPGDPADREAEIPVSPARPDQPSYRRLIRTASRSAYVNLPATGAAPVPTSPPKARRPSHWEEVLQPSAPPGAAMAGSSTVLVAPTARVTKGPAFSSSACSSSPRRASAASVQVGRLVDAPAVESSNRRRLANSPPSGPARSPSQRRGSAKRFETAHRSAEKDPPRAASRSWPDHSPTSTAPVPVSMRPASPRRASAKPGPTRQFQARAIASDALSDMETMIRQLGNLDVAGGAPTANKAAQGQRRRTSDSRARKGGKFDGSDAPGTRPFGVSSGSQLDAQWRSASAHEWKKESDRRRQVVEALLREFE